jgi:cytochrome b involved in lipid metabolism
MFLDNHPGGPVLLTRNSGKDMTASFFGGVYAHSHAAHNVRTMILFAYPMMLMTDCELTRACYVM